MKSIIIVIILSFIIFSADAQDIILKNNGEEISANVIEITPDLIKYKKYNWSASPLYSLYIKDINKITFSDGNVEIFNSKNIEENIQEENIKEEKIKKKNNTYTITDSRDDKEYKIVKIGTQDWFAENLSFKTENSLVYNKNEVYSERIGRLYYFDDALNACPDGWHLPSDEEWKELEIELGMINNVDGKGWRGTHPGQGLLLKKGGGSNFDAVYSGYAEKQFNQPFFSSKATKVFFWTSSENIDHTKRAWARQLEYRASIKRSDFYKTNFGFSVRCVKDN